MVFWNQATFVTYGWNGQERKVRLLSAVVCDGQHKDYAVANEELRDSVIFTLSHVYALILSKSSLLSCVFTGVSFAMHLQYIISICSVTCFIIILYVI